MDDLLIAIPRLPGSREISQHLDAEVLLGYLRQEGFRCSIVHESLPRTRSGGHHGAPWKCPARLVYWHLPSRASHEAFPPSLARARLQRPAEQVWIAGGAFGGPYDTMLLARYPEIQAVARGELERPLEEVLTALRDGRSWRESAGLTVRGTGKPIRNPVGGEPMDLHRLPPAADDLFVPHRREAGQKILFNRGCNSNCQYCGYQTFFRRGYPGATRFWRTRSPLAIVDEIERYVRRHGVTRFIMQAAVFFGYEEEGSEVVESVASEILRRKLGITFKIVTHPEHLVRNRSLLPLLQDAGLDVVFLGLDSGSPAALRRYGVGFDREVTLQALRLLHDRKVTFTPGLIFYDPYSTLAEVHEQLGFLREIQPLFTHMPPPYPYFLDRHLLHKSLQIDPTVPLFEGLKADGLLVQEGGLDGPSTARFRDPQVARLFRLHRTMAAKILSPLRPLLWNRSCVDAKPALATLPLDLIDHLAGQLESERVSLEEIGEHTRSWLWNNLEDDLEEMMETAALAASKRERIALGRNGPLVPSGQPNPSPRGSRKPPPLQESG